MEKQQFEVVMSLMTHHIKNNRTKSDELKEALDVLNTMFFMLDQIKLAVGREGIEYIGTDDFHRIHHCIDANKVRLFKIIASI